MSELKLDPDPAKTRVQFRCGYEARILGVIDDVILGAYKIESGRWVSFDRPLSGKANQCGDTCFDLINAPEPPVKAEGWVNVYEQLDSSLVFTHGHPSKDYADRIANPNRFACKRIEFEVRRGEGLE